MTPLKGPRPVAAEGMVLVTLKHAMAQHDYGTFRLIPFEIQEGQPAVAGDHLEVDQETADRWIAAGIADAYVAPPANGG